MPTNYEQWNKIAAKTPNLEKAEPTFSNLKFRLKPEDEEDVYYGQNQLRYELIKTTFDRVKDGMNKGNYFEVICLCDSLITDRFGRLLQFITQGDDEEYIIGSLGETAQALMNEIEVQQKLDFGKHIIELINEVFVKKWSWSDRRNTAIHGFCTVHKDNLNMKVKERDKFNKETAQWGASLMKLVVRETDRILRELHKDGNYGSK